jgi:hypothetical protein
MQKPLEFMKIRQESSSQVFGKVGFVMAKFFHIRAGIYMIQSELRGNL